MLGLTFWILLTRFELTLAISRLLELYLRQQLLLFFFGLASLRASGNIWLLRSDIIFCSFFLWTSQSCFCSQSCERGGIFMRSAFIITIQQQFSMGETQEQESMFSQLKTWFVQLSFWKKIIIIFTLNTCILLILTDAIMLTLFGKISNDIIGISDSEKNQFNEISNTQIVQVTSRMVLSQIDFYANILAQLVNCYAYFTQNPDIYTSLEGTNPQNPQYTSSFPNVSYEEPAYYPFNGQSTFTPLPFIDQLLPNLLKSTYYLGNVQRINVYVLNNSNANDLSARTFPATDTFTIPSLTTITNRFISISPGKFNISSPYIDSLTTEPNKTQLIGIRTAFTSSDESQTIMIEIQVKKSMLSSILSNIYYFPSTTVILFQKIGNNYTYYSNNPSRVLLANITDYYKLGTNRVSYSVDVQSTSVNVATTTIFVGATVGLSNSYTLGQPSIVTNQTTDPIRCAVVVNSIETQTPANDIQKFLQSQSSILTGIVLSWSFVILMSTVALATVVGNYIFFNLKMLSTKMQEYIKDPSRFHNIVIELKELDLKGILKRLSDNLIAIIQKIEVRKKERKDRINQNYHPLSIGEPKFQERQQLNDYEILEKIKQQVKIKVEIMQREAEEKERAEKEKVEREEREKQQKLEKEQERQSNKQKKE